jgi:hypothetical protein
MSIITLISRSISCFQIFDSESKDALGSPVPTEVPAKVAEDSGIVEATSDSNISSSGSQRNVENKNESGEKSNLTDISDNPQFPTVDNPWGDYYDDYGDYEKSVDSLENQDTSVKPKEQSRESAESAVENLPPEIYCDLVRTLEDRCLITSLLELWSFSEETVSKLTTDEIIDAVNSQKKRFLPT